ncbi:MAG: hypothetical protein RR400_02620, partial [Clostridia bacterium]
MKKIVSAFLLAITAILCQSSGAVFAAGNLAPYSGKIEHFFTHELVFETNKAFSPNNKIRKSLDMDHLTTKEYENILQSFYEKDFILVDFFH